MAQTPKKTSQPAQPAAPQPRMTKRASARALREQRRQRLIVIITAAVIGVSLLSVVIGVLYDQVWIPSRPIAQANNVTLTRNDYWNERRHQLARDIANNLQLLGLFGGQLGGDFGNQIPSADLQIETIRTTPVDEATVDNWVRRQAITSGATSLNIQVSDADIAQALTSDLRDAFPPPAPPVTDTASLTPTTTLTDTDTLTGTDATTATTAAETNATAEAEPTAADELTATATTTATSTPAPTPTPVPTLLPDVAVTEQEQIINRVYDRYLQEIANVDPQRRANLTIDDFKQALREQYRERVLITRVQEQLVPEAGFEASTEPTSYEVRHILLRVTAPLTETESVREAAYAERRLEAEAILEELREGADFETLAQERSEDFATREAGGRLPAFDATGQTQSGTQMDPAIVTATLELEENGISDLVQTPFGWHIVQLIERVVPSEEDQLRERRTEAFDTWVDEQRAAANVQRFPPQTPSPTTAPTEVVPLPTVPLAGEPTEVPPTDALTDTGVLTDTGAPADTTATAEAEDAEDERTTPTAEVEDAKDERTTPTAEAEAETATPTP